MSSSSIRRVWGRATGEDLIQQAGHRSRSDVRCESSPDGDSLFGKIAYFWRTNENQLFKVQLGADAERRTAGFRPDQRLQKLAAASIQEAGL